MPSPILQNMINLIGRLFIRGRPSEFMNVTVWEHLTFDNKNLDVAIFTTLIPLSLLIWWKTLIPNCWFEIVFRNDFGIEIS
jgi:hypothetical protein